MSAYDYHASLRIAAQDYPFYALIMAAMRQADDDNIKRLQDAFPWVWVELNKRYNAPGGILDEDVNKNGPDDPGDIPDAGDFLGE